MQIEFNQKHRKNQYLCRFRQLLSYYNTFLNTAYNTCSFHIYLSPLQTSRRGRLRHIDPRAVIALLRYPVCGCVAHRPQPLAQVAPPATGGAPIAPLQSFYKLRCEYLQKGKLAFSCFFCCSAVQWIHERGFDTFTYCFYKRGKSCYIKSIRRF